MRGYASKTAADADYNMDKMQDSLKENLRFAMHAACAPVANRLANDSLA
jgi:hypothetical protein